MIDDSARSVPQRNGGLLRELLVWMSAIALAACSMLLLHAYVFDIITVNGNSMNDTLFTDDRLLVSKFDCLGDNVPARGSVVICRYPGRKELFVKRLVGLPGDKIQVTGGATYINDALQIESYISHPAKADFGPYTLGSDEYFVLGDNRGDSADSRKVGPLSGAQIVATVRFRLWPIERIGSISVRPVDD